MSLMFEAKNDLNNFARWNNIYYFDETEIDKYNEIKELVKQKKDYGFLDIVMDIDDFEEIERRYERLKDQHMSKLECLYILIMQKAGFDMKEDDLVIFHTFKSDLNRKANEQGKKYTRLLFLLDSIKDIGLQNAINELICNRDITIMCYTLGPLLTYATTNGNVIVNVHDFSAIGNYKVKKKVLKGDYYD